MQNIAVLTWPSSRESLVLNLLDAILDQPIVRRHKDATLKLIEYDEFPTGVIARYEAALTAQDGIITDSAAAFYRFASEDFDCMRNFRTRWLKASRTNTLIVPRDALRADPRHWISYLLTALGHAEKMDIDDLTRRAEAWLAKKPAFDVRKFRHFDPEIFNHLGRLALPRKLVQTVFKKIMDRALEEKSILNFQTKLSPDSLRQALKQSAEYKTRMVKQAVAVAKPDRPRSNIPPTLIHLHVPKSAGTSLTAILAGNFSAGQKISLNPSQMSVLDAMSSEARKKLRLIFGHLPHGVATHLAGRPAIYVCALRQPGPRLLSYFRYMKRKTDHPLYSILNAKNMTFGAFLEFCVANPEQRTEADNGQIRRLAGRLAVGDLGNEAAIFQLALRNVFAPDMIFGLTERFETLLETLVNRGLITSYETLNANAAPETVSFEAARADLSSHQKDLLESFVAWDQKLYDICETYLFGLNLRENRTPT